MFLLWFYAQLDVPVGIKETRFYFNSSNNPHLIYVGCCHSTPRYDETGNHRPAPYLSFIKIISLYMQVTAVIAAIVGNEA